MTEDVLNEVVSFGFVPLTKAHDRAAFDCGVPSLNLYLHRAARQNQDRDIGRTCVALEPGQVRVWGYYTLSSASTEFEEYPENAGLPRYPVPAVLLARLAVDKQRHGQGLRRELLVHALGVARRHADGVGAALVIVEAIDETAQAFYERYGFRLLNKPGRHLYLAMKQIRRMP